MLRRDKLLDIESNFSIKIIYIKKKSVHYEKARRYNINVWCVRGVHDGWAHRWYICFIKKQSVRHRLSVWMVKTKKKIKQHTRIPCIIHVTGIIYYYQPWWYSGGVGNWRKPACSAFVFQYSLELREISLRRRYILVDERFYRNLYAFIW